MLYVFHHWPLSPVGKRRITCTKKTNVEMCVCVCVRRAAYLKLLAHVTDMCGRNDVHRGSPLLSLAVIMS